MRIGTTDLRRSAEVIANFSLAHSLAIAGSFFVVASVTIKWLNFPFSRDLSGVELPLLHELLPKPHLQLLSYGIVAIVTVALGLLGHCVSRRILALAAGVLLTLCVLAPLQVSLLQPATLHRLAVESRELSAIEGFTKEYQPENHGKVADVPKRISSLGLNTARARLSTGMLFLAPGWYMFTLGVLLYAAYSVTRTADARTLRLATFAAIPVAVIALSLVRPLIGEWFYYHAIADQAQGRNAQAVTDYRRAMRYDTWYSEELALYGTIGDLEGDESGDSPERRIYKGEQFREAGQYEAAVFEFEHAALSSGRVGIVARRAVAQTRYEYGIALYRAGGIGSALTNWQSALSSETSMSYVLPFLAQGNFDLSRYQSALEVLGVIIKTTSHPTLLANAYSLAGDCYSKLGRDADARRNYRLSLKTDLMDNHWALSALVGNTP